MTADTPGHISSGDDIHGTNRSTTASGQSSYHFTSGEFPKRNPPPPPPLPGTYVVQLPKDQIYRIPPPENARRYKHLSSRKPRRRRCCCFCSFLAAVLLIAVIAAIAAGVLYLVFKPEKPRFSIIRISVGNFNATSKSLISPEFNITLISQNPNGKIGMYYEKGSAVSIFYNGVKLGDGVTPAFYQREKNVTALKTALTGWGIQLTGAVRKELVSQQKNGTVSLRVTIRAPVKFKMGSVKTWTVTVNVSCGVTVDKLTAAPKVADESCYTHVDLW